MLHTPTTTPQDLTDQGWKLHNLPGFMEQAGPLWSLVSEDGTRRYGCLMEDKHLNAAGIVHGGVLLTLADHAASAAAWLHTQRQTCVTVHLDAQFLAPAHSGNWVVCTVEISHSTNSLVFARVQLHCEAQLLLSAQGLLKILPAPTKKIS